MIIVADALGQITCSIDVDTAVCDGDLVVIELVDRGDSMLEGRLIERHEPIAIDGSGRDVARLLYRGIGASLRQRDRVIHALRTWFSARGFIEITAPIIVPSPGLDLHLEAVAAGGGYLITSPEYQLKRVLVGGVPRCFSITPCFRRDESGAWHNPEFSMLEWYRSFAGYEHVIDDTEALVVEALTSVGRESFRVRGRAISLTRPFRRMTVADAFSQFAATTPDETLDLAAHDEDEYFRRMIEKVEPAIAELETPVFLVDYPASQASLARRKPGDPRWAERFELFVGGIELCNGFGELTDAREQRQRLERDHAERVARGLDVYPIDQRFLGALECGMPPSAGNALGLDRLVALAVGASTIADVQAFPSPEL